MGAPSGWGYEHSPPTCGGKRTGCFGQAQGQADRIARLNGYLQIYQVEFQRTAPVLASWDKKKAA